MKSSHSHTAKISPTHYILYTFLYCRNFSIILVPFIQKKVLFPKERKEIIDKCMPQVKSTS